MSPTWDPAAGTATRPLESTFQSSHGAGDPEQPTDPCTAAPEPPVVATVEATADRARDERKPNPPAPVT